MAIPIYQSKPKPIKEDNTGSKILAGLQVAGGIAGTVGGIMTANPAAVIGGVAAAGGGVKQLDSLNNPAALPPQGTSQVPTGSDALNRRMDAITQSQQAEQEKLNAIMEAGKIAQVHAPDQLPVLAKAYDVQKQNVWGGYE